MAPATEEFPDEIPIFPLSGVLLLPRCRLPLNIFEPRYLKMTEDVLATHRMIGMVQPLDDHVSAGAATAWPGTPTSSVGSANGDSSEEAEEPASEDEPDELLDEPDPARLVPPARPAVYPIGCAGRITSFRETDDDRYLITLTGLARFRIREEVGTDEPYRLVVPEWDPFDADLGNEGSTAIERERLLKLTRSYFDAHGFEANWEVIRETTDDQLVNSLAMICPFDPGDKQALLEARDTSARGRVLGRILEIAAVPALDEEASPQH